MNKLLKSLVGKKVKIIYPDVMIDDRTVKILAYDNFLFKVFDEYYKDEYYLVINQIYKIIILEDDK